MDKTILQEADDLISGPRKLEYGEASISFRNIAAQWNLYLFQRHGIKPIITPQDVCWMMADLKKCRHIAAPKRDNLVDAVGYIGLVEKLGS